MNDGRSQSMRSKLLGWSLGAVGAASLLFSASALADSYDTVPAAYPGWDRFSLIYAPEVLLSNSSLPAPNGSGKGMSPGTTFQNIGLEISSRTGRYSRYHGQ
jgi:hypothetical protein